MILALSPENLILVHEKLQRCRPACASVFVICSGKYNSYTCYILACLWFEHYLVSKNEDQFSHGEAHILNSLRNQKLTGPQIKMGN